MPLCLVGLQRTRTKLRHFADAGHPALRERLASYLRKRFLRWALPSLTDDKRSKISFAKQKRSFLFGNKYELSVIPSYFQCPLFFNTEKMDSPIQLQIINQPVFIVAKLSRSYLFRNNKNQKYAFSCHAAPSPLIYFSVVAGE